jgi:hypothetical protein
MPRKHVSEREKELVLSQLRVGKATSVPARVIANEMNLRSDRTDVLVRSIISELIEDGNAIGSWKRGYYIIETEDELEEVIEGIMVRIRGMQRRIKKIRANFAG